MSKNQEKICLSGIKPTGKIHLGNYFGAIKQWLEFSKNENLKLFVMVADYHALNFIQNKKEMKSLTEELVADYLALGLDPKKVVIFKQSDISAHTELTWIFNTLVSVPFLERSHAFKDATNKGNEISMGTFDYPVLMASDILLYGTDIVPVGNDQKQHIEYARDIADKFNFKFKKIFKLPEPVILESVKIIPGTDGRKMSKSYGNTISLFADDEEIKKAVMGIITDSSGDIPINVYAIHKLLKTEEELKNLYEKNKGKYKILKEELIKDLKEFIKPLREKKEKITKKEIYKVLEEGKEKANEVASEKLKEVKKAIGVF